VAKRFSVYNLQHKSIKEVIVPYIDSTLAKLKIIPDDLTIEIKPNEAIPVQEPENSDSLA